MPVIETLSVALSTAWSATGPGRAHRMFSHHESVSESSRIGAGRKGSGAGKSRLRSIVSGMSGPLLAGPSRPTHPAVFRRKPLGRIRPVSLLLVVEVLLHLR